MAILFLQSHWVFFGSLALLVASGGLFSYVLYRSVSMKDQTNENQKIEK